MEDPQNIPPNARRAYGSSKMLLSLEEGVISVELIIKIVENIPDVQVWDPYNRIILVRESSFFNHGLTGQQNPKPCDECHLRVLHNSMSLKGICDKCSQTGAERPKVDTVVLASLGIEPDIEFQPPISPAPITPSIEYQSATEIIDQATEAELHQEAELDQAAEAQLHRSLMVAVEGNRPAREEKCGSPCGFGEEVSLPQAVQDADPTVSPILPLIPIPFIRYTTPPILTTVPYTPDRVSSSEQRRGTKREREGNENADEESYNFAKESLAPEPTT
jgi:hypothetical protein